MTWNLVNGGFSRVEEVSVAAGNSENHATRFLVSKMFNALFFLLDAFQKSFYTKSSKNWFSIPPVFFKLGHHHADAGGNGHPDVLEVKRRVRQSDGVEQWSKSLHPGLGWLWGRWVAVGEQQQQHHHHHHHHHQQQQPPQIQGTSQKKWNAQVCGGLDF